MPGPSHRDVECSKFVQKIKHTGRSGRYMQCCTFANKHLEKGINVFKFLKIVQFLQIQNVLESTGEEGQDDLVKLRDDLVELIHVSEGTFFIIHHHHYYYYNN